MAAYESIFAEGENPYGVSEDTARAQRRATRPVSEAPIEGTDPYKGNWLAETTRSQLSNTLNDFTNGVEFLGRGLIGDDEGRQRAAGEYLDAQQRAREMGPQIQSFDDAEAAGGGFGNYGAALAYQGAALVPDIAATMTGIGLGGAAARRGVRKAVTSSIADAIENRASNVAAKEVAIREATRRAAINAPDGAKAVSNAVRVARRETLESSRKAAMEEAVKIAGRTPRTGVNRFARTIDDATAAGGRAGGTLASMPGLNGSMNAEKAADENTSTSDMWKLAAGTGAAAATQVIPIERFLGKFGKGATDAVAKSGQKLLPRMVKEFAAQGLAEGTQETAQQALQLASHAWVEKNLSRLTDDDAIDQYIASFAAGALIGGAMGAGGEAGRSAGRGVAQGAQKLREGAAWTRDKIAEGLGSYAERARRARVAPGTPVNAEGEPVAAGASPRDLLRRGMDAARGVGDAVLAAGKSAAKRFRDYNDDLAFDEDISARVDKVYQAWEQGGAPMILGERRAANQNPVAIDDRLQAHLMSYVRADSPVWGLPEATQRVAKALGRLFEGNPTKQDRADLEGLVESGSLARETMDSMAVIGQHWNGLHKLVRRTGADADATDHSPGEAVAPDGPMAEQLRALRPQMQSVDQSADLTQEDLDEAKASDAEGDVVNDALNERRGRSAEPVTPAERVANAHAASKANPDDEAAYAEFQAARADLRADMHGPKSEKYKLGSNVVYQSGKDPAPFQKLLDEGGANRVEIEPIDISRKQDGSLPARAALSLDSLLTRYVNQFDQYDTSTAEGREARAKAALMQIFADLKSAGIKVRASSITPGWFGDKGRAKNGTYIGYLSPRDAAELRTMITQGEKAGDVKAGQKARFDRPMTKGEKGRAARADEAANYKEENLDKAYGTEREEARMGEHEIDSGKVEDDRKLAPRSLPPGQKGADGEFVSTTSSIEDVRGSDELGEIARKARKEAVDLGLADHQSPVRVEGEDTGKQRPPSKPAVRGERADPRFKAGIEIGLKVLESERDSGAISERRFNVQVTRLQNPESGLAAKYYNDALAGKHVKASVSEIKADKNKVDTKAERGEKVGVRDKFGSTPGFDPDERPDPKMAPPMPVAKVLGNDPDKGRPAPKEKDDVEKKPKSKKRLVKKGDYADDVGQTLDSKDGGEHDLKRETSMLNAILRALKIDNDIEVIEHGQKISGGYRAGQGKIMIGRGLYGAERMEVLAHELGHHIVQSEIARAAGVPVTSLPAGLAFDPANFKLWEKHNPELFAALQEDFDKWQEANPLSQSNKVTRASRAAPHRAARVLSIKDGRTGNDLTVEETQYLYSFHEYLADQISRALTSGKQGRSIIEKFFDGIASLLRQAYAAMTLSERREWKPAPSVDAWVKSMFNREVAAVKQTAGVSVPVKTAQASVRAAAADSIPGPHRYERKNLVDLVQFVKYVLPREERAILDRVFNRTASAILLRKHFADFPEMVALLDDGKQGLESRIALGYIAWQEGAFKTGPEGRQAFKGVRDSLAELLGASAEGELAERTLSDIANGTVQHFHDKNKTYSVRALEARARGNAQMALNWVSQQGPISNLMAKFWQGTYSRMVDSGIPAMREIGAILQRPHGATGDDDRGMITAIRHTQYRFHRKVENAFKDLDPGERVRVLSVLQRGAAAGQKVYDGKSPKVRAAVDAMRTVMEETYQYLKEAGIDFPPKERFFPVLMDIRTDDAGAKLQALYEQPKFEDAMRAALGMEGKKYQDVDLATLARKMVELTGHETDGFDPTANKIGARHLNHRVSQFVYDLGDANDLRTFASLQTKNIDEVFARYFSPIIKFAEYKRREESLKTALAEITKQGGNKEDVALANDAIKAALGTYGMDGSPTLAALSPDLAKRFSGAKTKAFVQGTQAYENLRLLPLAILSSLVDPMGIAVRTGGEFKSTWEGAKAGIRSLTNKKDARELLAMLEELGVADDFMPAIASHPVFDGQESNFARKVNEAVFKWNGMNAWVRSTRVMAAHAGHRFLLKHAKGDGDDSARYLAELGVKPADIVENPDKPGQVVLNDKTRAALAQFVDEAVLRPNAMQVPLWHRDPYMGLLTQYKAFGYAIYDQITNRVFREMEHGNFRVLLAAASYLPIIIFAELLRELIQHGTDGNPNREEWGPDDYALYATSRSGLLGPQANTTSDIIDDVKRDRLPGTSLLGPAGQQAGNVVKSFEGRRDLGKEFESALPGSAAYKNWNDGRAEEAA